MEFPSELKYSKTHEWVRLEKKKEAVIGITDYAQNELGDIVYLELPEEDETIEKDDAFGVIESTKATEDLYSPVSGRVIEVNTPLLDSPGVINEDPYVDGWLLRVELKDLNELSELMTAEEYRAYIEEISG